MGKKKAGHGGRGRPCGGSGSSAGVAAEAVSSPPETAWRQVPTGSDRTYTLLQTEVPERKLEGGGGIETVGSEFVPGGDRPINRHVESSERSLLSFRVKPPAVVVGFTDAMLDERCDPP
ncbi:unnamed protein product [Rangifer tarandus platyrhynchus]|uniref:Uncharacterized protein n=1 Tax=Rangifer tarandus platyrhynchus TaxID=3082113 RepID=A0ACB1MJV9_RANTA